MDENAPSTSKETHFLKVRPFVTARVSEIVSLTAQLRRGPGGKAIGSKGLAFQHVPKHMRRRAVSHQPNRLPKRLRAVHLAQVLKSTGKKKIKKRKRPRSKFRKRPQNKLLEYNRRQLKNPLWLESHVWHAKRFHMKPLWGKRLPYAPTAKCFRALFRAARNGVIMQDISYLSCLQLSGSKERLLAGMTQLLPRNLNEHVSESASTYHLEQLGFLVSSTTSLYLGTIKYLWVPQDSAENGKIIMWLQPTLMFSLIEELTALFQLVKIEEDQTSNEYPESPNIDEVKYGWKTIPNGSWTNATTKVLLRDMTGFLNRIRITGLKTLPVLKEILKIGQLTSAEDSSGQSIQEQQANVWKGVTKIVDFRNNSVLPLNVIDPRLELPGKRYLVQVPKQSSDESEDKGVILQKLSFESDLWDERKCRELLRTKISDLQISKSRSGNLIPGTSITDGVTPNVIPIVIVFRSGGSSRQSQSSFVGADVIVPIGWLMPFWIALSYRCCRAYGQEFGEYLTFEQDPFLHDMPVSAQVPLDFIEYSENCKKHEEDRRAKYFGRPPAKRQNLLKLGCAFPFSVDWSRFLRYAGKLSDSIQPPIRVIRKMTDIRIVAESLRRKIPEKLVLDDSLLLSVEVTLICGTVEECAAICIPTSDDYELLASPKHTEVHIIQDPFPDANERKRSTLSHQHIKKLAHLRKKRKKARRAMDPTSFDLVSRLKELNSKEESEHFNRTMNKLWLVSDVEDVLSKQNREVMGFTTYGHFSFLRGKCAATGYVSVGQMRKLLQEQSISKCKGKHLFVLVRNWASTLTYHWARLNYPNDNYYA